MIYIRDHRFKICAYRTCCIRAKCLEPGFKVPYKLLDFFEPDFDPAPSVCQLRFDKVRNFIDGAPDFLVVCFFCCVQQILNVLIPRRAPLRRPVPRPLGEATFRFLKSVVVGRFRAAEAIIKDDGGP
jgi:hypothetical protein